MRYRTVPHRDRASFRSHWPHRRLASVSPSLSSEAVFQIRRISSIRPDPLFPSSVGAVKEGRGHAEAEPYPQHPSHPKPECILPLPAASGGGFVGTSAFH